MRATKATAAVVGTGHSRVLRRATEPLGRLAVEACRAAIADAGLAVSDIDGIVTAPAQPFDGAGSLDGVNLVTAGFMAQALGIRAGYLDQSQLMLGHAFMQGVNAVCSGAAKNVLVFRALHNPSGRYGRTDQKYAVGDAQFQAPYGATVVAMIAPLLRRYMEQTGGTREMLGEFVVRSRRNGLSYENSFWAQNRPEEISLDDYLSSRPIVDPITVLDCDLPVQGAGAFVITSSEHAADLVDRPAQIRGMAVSPTTFTFHGFGPTVEDELGAGRELVDLLYANAEIDAADIDVANVYDGFSSIAVMWSECLGLAPPGQGMQWLAEPTTPYNTSGGNLGGGRLHGMSQLTEGVLQVMDRAGQRQIEGADVSVVVLGSPFMAQGIVLGTSAT